MKKITLTLITAAAFSGCTTLQLPKGPDVSALKQYEGSPRVGVSEVRDARTSTKVGTIGAAGFKVRPDDLKNLSTRQLIEVLNSEMEINVQRTAELQEGDIPTSGKQYDVDRFVTAQIKGLNFFSSDSLLQPVDVNMGLEVAVYDREGAKIFGGTFYGQHTKRIGIATPKGVSGLIEAVIKDTMERLKSDAAFKKSVGI